MQRLLATDGREEWFFPVPAGEARLGSQADNDLVLPVRGVSRHHALVRRCRGGVEVVDLRSKNGVRVGGTKVERAILTPGLRVQLGAAWLEFQEVSSAEDALARLAAGRLGGAQVSSATGEVGAGAGEEPRSSPETALRLAYRLQFAGAGTPGERPALLAELRLTLGAEALVCFRQTPSRGALIRESDGLLAPREERGLGALVGALRAWPGREVQVRREGQVLIAGRGRWFLAARYGGEPAAMVKWRRDLLRIAAEVFFAPVMALADLDAAEIRRALELTAGNKKRASELLGISRQKLYDVLRGLRPKKNKPPAGGE